MNSFIKRAGFSLIEVVLAAGIFAVAVTVMLALLPALTRQSAESTDALVAQRLPDSLRVELRRLAANDFNGLASAIPAMGTPLDNGLLFVASRDGSRLHSANHLPPATSQVSSAGTYQVQARQNALTGLNVGLGELQRHAGDDTRITAMAGITGIGANAGNTTRHWCGVWRSDGTFVAWLVSGAQGSSAAALQNGVTGIELVAAGSVGAPAANSEHVIGEKIPIVVSETPGTPGVATTIGHYAFLVSDEGVKTPASSPAPFPVVAPVIFANATNAQSRLRDALATFVAKVPKVISYEQLAVLPSPALTSSILQDNFHHVTLASRTFNGTQLYGGMMNVNTNSAIFWRNLLQTYNTVPGIPAVIPSATVSARGTTMQNSLPAFTTAGKLPNGPFTSIASFGNYLATVFTATGLPTAAQIMAAVGPMLSARSDTFRIRAYGEALNPADPAMIEATAYCEAIVQRTTSLVPSGQDRKFVILYFRWLGADDI